MNLSVATAVVVAKAIEKRQIKTDIGVGKILVSIFYLEKSLMIEYLFELLGIIPK